MIWEVSLNMNEDYNNLDRNNEPEENKTEEVTAEAEQGAEPIADTGVETQSAGTEPETAQEPTTAAPQQEAPQTPPPSQWQNNGGAGGYYQVPPYQQPNAMPPYQGQGYGTPFGQQQSPFGQQPQNSPFGMNGQQPRQENIWRVSDYDQQPGGPNKPQKNKGLIVFSIVLAVALFFTAGSFALYAAFDHSSLGTESSNSAPTTSAPSLEINSRPAENPERTEDGTLTDTAIAKKVKPSVVGIVAYVKSRNQYQLYGEGSGIILTKDGYIVTNAHVITVEQSGALVDQIQVYLDNDESYSGVIVGADTRSDLAVIKINANNLTPAEFGDSTTVEVGEHVLAIGNPSGMALAGSVTDGIVSGVNRNIKSSSSGFSMNCIQTNAAINPGNSGGALVNAYGQVIGINSSKIVADEYEGIGFAIAISEAKPIIDSIIAKGYVEGRVKIGITYREIDDFTAALNQIPKGLEVAGIDSTLDVANSGLQVGDIITEMDGQSTTTTDEVTAFLKTKKPGETVKMTVYRITETGDATTLTIDVVLAEDRGQIANNLQGN